MLLNFTFDLTGVDFSCNRRTDLSHNLFVHVF